MVVRPGAAAGVHQGDRGCLAGGLEARGLGSVSINVRITAIRKLAAEAADNGLLAPELAAGIARVKSAKSMGVRTGNWLSLKQAQALLNAPDITKTKGLRDRAIIAVLLGCGLRRSEVAALTLKHIQQRDGRWCIVDLFGKHGRVRTVPMPTWVKVAIDAWTGPAGVVDGYVFRPVNRCDQVAGEVLSEKVVWQMLRPYATAAGVPGIAPHDCRRHGRETVPSRWRRVGADPVTAGPRVGPDHRAVPGHEAGSGSCAERRDQVKGGGVGSREVNGAAASLPRKYSSARWRWTTCASFNGAAASLPDGVRRRLLGFVFPSFAKGCRFESYLRSQTSP